MAAAAAAGAAEGAGSDRPSAWRRIAPWAVFAGLTTLLIAAQLLLVGVYQVRGSSMEPTLREGQRVVVARRFSEVARGDLLVFRNPNDPREVLIKRVLALPGERIEARRGQLYVGRDEPSADLLFAMAEPYVKPGTALVTLATSRVPEAHFYLLGDNRNESIDSRQLGAIPRRLVLGKVLTTIASGR